MDLWKQLLEAGEEYNIIPCGLAARDSLRVGAGLPLSHQDIGDWVFANNPWSFAVSETVSTNIESNKEHTYAYVGFDVRKLHGGTGTVQLDNKNIGEVLSCVSEVALTRIDGEIISIASDSVPRDHKVKGLVAGFFKVNKELSYGQIVNLSDGKRTLKVEVVQNIRPNRTARKAIKNMRSLYEQ